jgi:hypothetical protein|tara:strand:- start:390 stop:575 length:186 start_codon:yes stop_codon:yes gene_type:complete
MKIGDLVVNKAYQKYSAIVPAKMVVNVSNRAVSGSEHPYIVLEDEPEDWKPARNFFIVSPA